ncbi:MAG: polymer-forming cytoskeletal protein [Clostridiales bacterium]|nr:polymer-forming cytoskeletal protein [Clostridiales bacterium]
MDISISGSGKISAGEYETVRISGSGRLEGPISCEELRVSGSANGKSLICSGAMHVSGSCSFTGDIAAKSASVSGALKCSGSVRTEGECRISGAGKCEGSIKCGALRVSGLLSAGGGIEAESARISGVLNCGGLLNAETVDISFSNGIDIGAIGGSSITIHRSKAERSKFFSLFSFGTKPHGTVHVRQSIEGDEVDIEGVTAERVSCRRAVIGSGCAIKLLQYSDSAEIAPDAKVDTAEKI